MIRVGLVGHGLGGKVFHAPLIRACPRMELGAIMTSQDIPGAVRSLDELLYRCDLVVISSPNRTHFPLAQAALEAGKHVVLDKPFTASLDEADALIALAAERSLMLTVFHNRRWDGDYLTVRKLLPRLATVTLAEMYWDRFRPAIKPGWREVPGDGAGLLNDLGPHMVDQMVQLFGWPDSLSADLAIQREGALVDDFFELRFAYGEMRAVVGASTLVADGRARFALHGNGGSFVKHGLDPQEAALKQDGTPRPADFPGGETDGILTLADGTRETIPTARGSYPSFYEAVADSILDGQPVPVDPAEARDGLMLISLARSSATAGRRLPVPAASSTAI